MKPRWTGGNRLRLLENGEAYFPAVFEAIACARHEVVIETFILFEDKVGHALRDALLAAARRGVLVDVLVDGFGSCDLTPEFTDTLAAAGIHLRVFDPAQRVLGMRLNVLRRMHRKIVVVDAERAFVGGINFSFDHLAEAGPQAKQDYAVEVEGPIVAEIRSFVHSVIRRERRIGWYRTGKPACRTDEDSGANVLFVTRDNHLHRNDIEQHYRAAIRTARERVIIANAYFFPGYLLLREMRRATRRGVEVILILQGEPDMPIVKTAAGLLYDYLLHGGVRIFEYCVRPLHGKVAVVDNVWSTVGSSNLDPLSLSLNLEANLVIRDAAFARELGQRLERLIADSCQEVRATGPASRWIFWRPLRSFFVFHFTRNFAAWANWLPRHMPKLRKAGKPPGDPLVATVKHDATGAG